MKLSSTEQVILVVVRLPIIYLEKSRVVYQTPGERCYHSFYQLLTGATPDETNNLQLYEPHHFWYLNQSGCYQVDGIDDKAEYADVKHAMGVVGFNKEEADTVWQLVAGYTSFRKRVFL